MNKEAIFLLFALSLGLSSSLPTRKSKPEDLVATDSQIQFADTNGEFKTSVNTENSFRAESRQPDGSVKGVYGWISPEGKPVQVLFKSDAQNGYQTFSEVDKLDVNLPPLPSKLYDESDEGEDEASDDEPRQEEIRPRQRYHIPESRNGNKQASEDEPRKEEIRPRQRYRIPESRNNEEASEDEPREEEIRPRQRYRIPESRNNNIFQSDEVQDDDDDSEGEDNFVILEDDEGLVRDDEEEFAVFLEGEKPTPGVAAFVEGYEELLSELKPGTPVAQSNPSVTAVADAMGVAQADPKSSSIVGPGGVAISVPRGQALVGPGGIAISAPKSSSQAGPGGIAIASVYSTAVAGIKPPGDGDDEETQGPGGDPGFFKRDAGIDSILKGAAAPYITNYFFQFRLPEYYGAADLSKVREKFYKSSSRRRNRVSGRRNPNSSQIKAASTESEKVFYEAPDLQSISIQA